ncbi:MAG: His/Gly/Thr/Pro-type tRNA ligase C-terminal domain-containing protein, partial [Pseudomonadota bacterium]
AAGFALGLERLYSLVESRMTEQKRTIDVYMLALGEQTFPIALKIANMIRTEFPQLTIQMNCGGGSIKSQMKRADKSGARLALILGEEEVTNQEITIKHLQTDAPQQAVKQDDIINHLKKIK